MSVPHIYISKHFLLTDKVIVATKAQTKLRHIVLMLKLLVISCLELRMKVYDYRTELTSIENNTPPIGEPKATATPAALEAVMISRIWPEWSSVHVNTPVLEAHFGCETHG